MSQKGASYVVIILLSTCLPIQIGCNRKESDETKYELKDEDFFIKGLYYRADSASILKLVGIPDSVDTIKPSLRFPGGLLIWKYSDFDIIIDQMNSLFGIRALHAGFLSAKGLSVGDSINRVWELYGHSDRDNSLPHQAIYYFYNDNDTTGINITIENNLVKEIYAGHF